MLLLPGPDDCDYLFSPLTVAVDLDIDNGNDILADVDIDSNTDVDTDRNSDSDIDFDFDIASDILISSDDAAHTDHYYVWVCGAEGSAASAVWLIQ